MRLPRLRATSAALAAGLVGLSLVALTPAPAQAHKHPTPVELISPAVVRIQTYGRVSISLIENTVTGRYSSDTKLVQRTYRPLLASGSGFVVDPTGSIVTAPTVTGVDLNRAIIFAVNKVFNEKYGDGAPIPADPYTKAPAKPNSGDTVNQRLQRCYQPNTTDETGGCVVFVHREVVVQPFVSDQGQYGNLAGEVTYPTNGKKGDVSIVKVGANSMPSVNLGSALDKTAAVSTLGFTKTPSDEKSLLAIQGHLVKAGDPTLKNDEYIGQIRNGLRDGLLGGPIVNEKGLVVGILNNTPKNVTITTAEGIQSALSQAEVKATRGPTDGVYENALHNFNNAFYTAAAANLTQVLKLYPGDALAAEKLAIANQRKGTAADKGTSSSGDNTGFEQATGSSSADKSPNLLLWGGGAAIAVLAILLLVVVIRGRRKPNAGDGAPLGPQGGMPASGPPGQYPGMPYAAGQYPGGPYPGSAEPGAFAVPGVPGHAPGLPGYGPGVAGPGFGQQPGPAGMVPEQYPPLGTPYPANPAVPAGAPAPTGWEDETMRYLSPSAPPAASGPPAAPATQPAQPPQTAPAAEQPGTEPGLDEGKTMIVSDLPRRSVPADAGESNGQSGGPASADPPAPAAASSPPGVAEALTGTTAQTVLARPEVAVLHCTHCDQQVQPGQQFCGFCGNRVR